MERRLIIKRVPVQLVIRSIAIILVVTYTGLLVAQGPEKSVLLTERISTFTIRNKSSNQVLPVRHGITIEAWMTGNPEKKGKVEFGFNVFTDNWFEDAGTMNTFYLKDFCSTLVFSPGAARVTDLPEIRLINQAGVPSQEYNPVEISLSEEFRNCMIDIRASDKQPLNKEITNSKLPFQIPFFKDERSRIRAFQVIVSLDILDPGMEVTLEVDRAVLDLFENTNQKYDLPKVEDQVFVLKEKGYQSEIVDLAKKDFRFGDIFDPSTDILWRLRGEVSHQVDTSSDFLLYFGISPKKDLIGIKEIEIIAFMPSGSIEITGFPEIRSTSDFNYIMNKSLKGIDTARLSNNLYTNLAVSTYSGIIDPLDDSFARFHWIDYKNLLYQVWSADTQWDSYVFPAFRTDWNYPLFSESGEIQISFPIKFLRTLEYPSKILFRISGLIGDQKTNLKSFRTLLAFDQLTP